MSDERSAEYRRARKIANDEYEAVVRDATQTLHRRIEQAVEGLRGEPIEQVIPSHFGRLSRWWYQRFPLRYVCPITRWHHRWDHAWGSVTCEDCGERAYIEYGR